MTFALEHQLSERVGRLIGRGSIQPPRLPVLASELLSLAADPHTNFGRVARVVARDNTLAARVLQLANSVCYRGREPVYRLDQAMVRIGMNGLRQLILMVSTQGRVYRSKHLQPIMQQLWRHSVGAAIAADLIARRVGRCTDVAFMCGLLHDIGQPVVLNAIDQWNRTHSPSERLADDQIWRVIQRLHCEVGASVARSWGLPPVVRDTIAKHHDLANTSEDARIPALLVRAADAMCYEVGAGIDGLRPSSNASASLLKALGLSSDLIPALHAELRTRLSAVEGVF